MVDRPAAAGGGAAAGGTVLAGAAAGGEKRRQARCAPRIASRRRPLCLVGMGSTLTALLALVSCGEAGAGESPPLECRPRRGIHLHTPLFHIVGRMEPTAGGDHWPRGATDGNAVFGHDGMVHVMHQTPNRTSHTPAQPTQGYWASWGHVVSDDLAHFRRVQNALDPGFSSSYDWHGISPVLRRRFTVLSRLSASWRQDGENGRKMA